MKKIITTAILLLFITTVAFAGKKKIQFTTSQTDASVYVDDKFIGKSNVTVFILKESCVTVRIEKEGFLTYYIEFCNKKTAENLPKKYHIKMDKDDAYAASLKINNSNNEVKVKARKGKDASWKLLNQILLSYSDDMEASDKETGYLRTAWQLKTFKQNTIRTRIIVKEHSSDPLVFKIKLVSEESNRPLTNSKSDEFYTEWNRVLRKYKDVITEIQSRL
jgi:hypothetical protein